MNYLETLKQIPNKYGHNGIGGFAALFNDELAICTDGIGNKARVAFAQQKFDTLGIDLIAMNVNDLICVGAWPMAIVDHISIPWNREDILDEVAKGLVKGAEIANIDIPGGETEIVSHFGLYGTAVGYKAATISSPRKGDIIIGLPSSGIHCNGIGVAIDMLGIETSALLDPTTIYSPAITSLFSGDVRISGLANITSGGIDGNLKRVVKEYEIENTFPAPDIFCDLTEIACTKGVPAYVGERNFDKDWNYGIGFIVIVDPDDCSDALSELNRFHDAKPIGLVH